MYKIYFAGDLFDQKHITGNFLLAKSIEKASDYQYTCILPQDWEGALHTSIEIRNRDLQNVIQADMVLFNFDGVDLDSGTVVEFMIAKMLDIPAVLLRTDFRNGGYLFGDDWNLMVAGYPRCAIVKNASLMLYNELGLEKMHQHIAQSVVESFKKVLLENSLFNTHEEVLFAYQHVVKMCAAQLENLISGAKIDEIIASKLAKNIYNVKLPAASCGASYSKTKFICPDLTAC